MTRFPALLTAGMHGIEHRITDGCALRLSAPRKLVFTGSRFDASWRAAALLPQRNRGLVTAFHSPATATGFPGIHSRVNAPSLLLRSLAHQLACPFGFSAPQLRNGSPHSGLFPRFKPVACLLTNSSGRLVLLHSPSGFLLPYGSKRSTNAAAFRFTFRIRPIFARSP